MPEILRDTFGRLAELEQRLRAMRERIAAASDGPPLRDLLDPVLRELDAKRRTLANRASAFGVPETAFKAPAQPRDDRRGPKSMRAPSAMAAGLITKCEACAKRLCALAREARAIKDTLSERIAFLLMGTLEKLLWLLQPYAEGADSHGLSRISGKLQLRAIAP